MSGLADTHWLPHSPVFEIMGYGREVNTFFFHDLAFCPAFVKILKKGMINQ